MKRTSSQTIPTGWQLPKSAEYDCLVRLFSNAVQLADSGRFRECLEIRNKVRATLTHLSICSEFRHSGHIQDWTCRWNGLEGRCHRALGQQTGDKSRESFGAEWEAASQFSAVYSAHGDRYPTGTCLQLFERGIAQYERAVIAWHDGAPREEVLEELQRAIDDFQRLCELCPMAKCYFEHLQTCQGAVSLISDSRPLPRQALAKCENFRANEPGTITLLKTCSDLQPASYEREMATASAQATRANQEIEDLAFGFGKFVSSVGPMLLIGIALAYFSQCNVLLGVFSAGIGPILMGALATSCWMWMSGKVFRSILSLMALILSVGCSNGISDMSWPLAVGASICFLISLCAGLYLLVRTNDVFHRSPAVYRLISHLARLRRQTDDLSVEWARWIRRELPSAVATLLTEGDVTAERPHLCFWLEWMPASCVYAKDAHSVLLLCGQVVLEFGELLIETLIPPRRIAPTLHQRDHANVCTSWAVLLRCPLHLARGDGIPDAC